MKTIWKYNLNPTDLQQIEIPSDFEILSVQTQGKKLCVWIMVDPDSEKVVRTFEVIGTGNEMKEAKRTFIDTFQMMGGGLVFHVFLRGTK